MQDSITDEMIEVYRNLIEDEGRAKWAQGDFIAELCQTLFPDRKRSKARSEYLQAFAERAGQSLATIRNRYLASSTFPPDTRAMDRSWYFHLLCARQSDPHAWMQRALEAGWSQTDLENHIAAAGGTTGRSWKGMQAQVIVIKDKALVLHMKDARQLADLRSGLRVVVTLVEVVEEMADAA